MSEVDVPELKGERVRYNDDTWEFTGTIRLKQNGSTIEAAAKKPERVRGSRGTLTFHLMDGAASLNPGNPGEFDVELERAGGTVALVVRRHNTRDRYRIKDVRYS